MHKMLGPIPFDQITLPGWMPWWATGYKVSFPFLDESLLSAPNNELPLYKRVVHPQLPGLYFVGLLQPVGASPPVRGDHSRLHQSAHPVREHLARAPARCAVRCAGA